MFAGQPLTITYLSYVDGTTPYTDWFVSLRDERAQARIAKRIARLEQALPDWRAFQKGSTS